MLDFLIHINIDMRLVFSLRKQVPLDKKKKKENIKRTKTSPILDLNEVLGMFNPMTMLPLIMAYHTNHDFLISFLECNIHHESLMSLIHHVLTR